MLKVVHEKRTLPYREVEGPTRGSSGVGSVTPRPSSLPTIAFPVLGSAYVTRHANWGENRKKGDPGKERGTDQGVVWKT